MSQHAQFIVISTLSRWHTFRSRWIMGRMEAITCPVTTALNRLTSRVKKLFLWYLAAQWLATIAFSRMMMTYIERCSSWRRHYLKSIVLIYAQHASAFSSILQPGITRRQRLSIWRRFARLYGVP